MHERLCHNFAMGWRYGRISIEVVGNLRGRLDSGHAQARELPRQRTHCSLTGQSTLEIAAHLGPRNRIPRGDDLGEAPLGDFIELSRAALLD
jgi:hypothetical protein